MLKNIILSPVLKELRIPWVSVSSLLHTSAVNQRLEKWMSYNDKVYPPQGPDETPRPAYVCHCKENIKYSYKKLWYIACLVRGMTVDEALKQLEFVSKKGAVAVRETILEAQQLAVNEHNVEFRSNLWVSESFVGKGIVLKGFRRCGKGHINEIKYRYTHYFVTLEEGTPPKDYYFFKRQKSGEELLSEWLQKMRNRKIIKTL